MDKILSKDTIKNVFSALGAKTSDSNYGVALLDKTSGEPKGLMGMSDLASVLGVDSEIMHNVYNNFNDVITPCRMLLLPGSQTYTNAPSQFTGSSTEGILVVFPFKTNISNPRIGQLILSNIGFFMRFKSSGGWTNWMKVANA